MSRIEEAIMKANLMRQNSLGTGEAPVCSPPTQDDSKRGTLRWMHLGSLLLALVAGGGIYHFATDTTFRPAPQPVPASVSAPAAPIARQANQPPSPTTMKPLPAGIPLNSPDPAFSTSHPGWQRYTTDKLDFRVFREGQKIRAIQVIALGEKAIENTFFSSFLRDVARGEKHSLTSAKERNGFYVEQGMAGKVAELLVYRKKPAGEIRAFVVAYL